MKNNLSYYSRMVNSHSHPKFKMLRGKFGWEGEGRFWALNDFVAEAENCMLNVTKKYTRASVANDLGLTLDQFSEFLDYLVKECELFYYEGDCITNDHLQETLESVMEDRKEAQKRYNDRKNRTSGEKSKTSGENQETSESLSRENIQSKVKESKVNKSREEGGTPAKESLFEEFWTAYPNKRNRDKAETQWKNLRVETTEGLFGLIMDALKKYRKTRQWQDPQFVPFAHNWLRDRRWKDDIGTVETANTKQAEPEPVPEYLRYDDEDFK